MYKSPIEIIQGQMQTQLEGEILRAVQQVGVNVDKDELIKALAYDRGQYEKGYADAMKKQQWISAEDRLPKESGSYLVNCDDSWCPADEGIWYQSGVVVCAEVDVGVNGGICWEWRDGETLYDLDGIVTHWMPLPEPPK